MSQYCEICNHTASSSSNYYKHCKTKLHARMIEKADKDTKNESLLRKPK